MTYVEPHFDLYEQRDRVTFFEKNYNISEYYSFTVLSLSSNSYTFVMVIILQIYKFKTIFVVYLIVVQNWFMKAYYKLLNYL